MMLHVHVFVAWLCSTTFHWQMFEQAPNRRVSVYLRSEPSGHFPHHLALRKSCQKCSNLGLGFGLGFLDAKLQECHAKPARPNPLGLLPPKFSLKPEDPGGCGGPLLGGCIGKPDGNHPFGSSPNLTQTRMNDNLKTVLNARSEGNLNVASLERSPGHV